MHRTLLASTSLPAAIAALGVRAESNDPVVLIRQISGAVTAMRENHNQMRADIDALATGRAAERLGQGDDNPNASLPVDREYTASFVGYARGDAGNEGALQAANRQGVRAAINAAMTVGDNSSGGYLAPVEWDRRINRALRSLSPMRRLANVVLTGVGAYSTLWSDDSWGSGWVGETANRPATATPTLRPIMFPTGEIYAMPVATQRMLDDAEVDVEGWISTSVAEEFARQEGVAFLSGDGVNKPMGLLQYVPGGAAATGTPGAHPGGMLDVVNSGAAATIPTPDVLVTFKYGLLDRYRQNARWLMNSQTAAAIALMKDGNGAYIWREGLAEDQPTTLLGRPVEIDENMPSIGAGTLPIAFGDFNAGYVINDRLGVRVLRDPLTNKPFVMFYTTKRVGGGLADPRAIRVLKVAAG